MTGNVVAVLPEPGEAAGPYSPDAGGQLCEINPAFIRFEPMESLGFKGMELVYGALFAVFFAAFAIPSLVDLHNALGHAPPEGVLMAVALIGGSAAWAYRAFKVLPEGPIILSRKTRRLYMYSHPRKEWITVAYDQLLPAIVHFRAVNAGGAISSYRLQVTSPPAVPGAEQRYIRLGASYLAPQACGELWEFIRRYMDGKPEDLPATALMPSIRAPGSWMALADKRNGTVDDDYRVTSLSAVLNFLFYWDEWATAWLARRAPEPEVTWALKQATQWEGENPYRIHPRSERERRALAGTLPSLRIRWASACLVSTSLHLGVFGFLIWIGLPSDLKSQWFGVEPRAAEVQQEEPVRAVPPTEN